MSGEQGPTQDASVDPPGGRGDESDQTAPQLSLAAIPAGVNSQIGPYRLLGLLGEGGFAHVYLAEQKVPFHRRVALKILKVGMDTRQVIARFEAERQALAVMDHPNIARVFDAGATDSGRPYFVMEVVRGEQITRYCDRQKLGIEERLGLFVQVCQAVQHAHQKGIIHRDLKPSNVLVTLADNRPVPKVIDFGVAKATAQPLTDRTVFTEQGQLIGTPEYMSPEQAEMTGSDIDTRSDVYSLGVLLYELLTGVLPFDARRLRRAALTEVQRIIRETDPPRPSTRLSSLGDDSQAFALRRATEPRTLYRGLRGDLDCIVMKALEKDRSRRYSTPLAMAEDVQRHLSHQPILARPAGLGLVTMKFYRRHRAAVAGAAAVLAAAMIGLGFWVHQMGATLEAKAHQAEAKAAALEAQRQTQELQRQRQEQWLPVCDFDFTKDTQLDPRWEACWCSDETYAGRTVVPKPDAVNFQRGGLVLEGMTRGVAILRWREAVGEDLRIEATIANESFIRINVCGDTLRGYRLVLVFDKVSEQRGVNLETIDQVQWEVFQRGFRPVSDAREHKVIFQKTGQWVRAWVDGVKQIEYFDPVPFTGPDHRTFALSSMGTSARVFRFAAWRRRSPEVVSVLDAGRDLLRQRQFAQAEAFFHEAAEMHSDSLIGIEARYLEGVALLSRDRASAALAALRQVTARCEELLGPRGDGTHQDAVRAIAVAALTQKAKLLEKSGDLGQSAAAALRAAELDPSPMSKELFATIGCKLLRAEVPSLSPSTQTPDPMIGRAACLKALVDMPVRELNLRSCRIETLSALKGIRAKELNVGNNRLKDLSALKGTALVKLVLGGNQITDLGPLAGIPLEWLDCRYNNIEDLNPLKGMPLKRLDCPYNNIENLNSLKGMPLKWLDCGYNRIKDLAPLGGSQLVQLDVSDNPIVSLSPLKGLPLTILFLRNCGPQDLSALKGMKLLDLDISGCRGADLRFLRDMPLRSLKISDNGIDDLSALKDLRLDNLTCRANKIKDLSPLAKSPLSILLCSWNRIEDLSPLRGKPISELECGRNPIRDFSVLRELPLKFLSVQGCRQFNMEAAKGLKLEKFDFSDCGVSDLSALKDMPLREVTCADNNIQDLSPLDGKSLTDLDCGWNQVSVLPALAGNIDWIDAQDNRISDLSPLKGKSVRGLALRRNRITDLSPLADVTAKFLDCPENQISDLSPLKGKSFRGLWLGRNRITDLSPLAGVTAESLNVAENQIADLSPLATAKVRSLDLARNRIKSLAPLKGKSLEFLEVGYNQVTDLSPLRGMGLKSLGCAHNPVGDLSPLEGMPLELLDVRGIPLTPANVETIASLPALRYVGVDLTDSGCLALLEKLGKTQCKAVNSHAIRYIASLAAEMSAALKGGPGNLKSKARRAGDFLYLAIPWTMNQDDAAAFCRRQGGYLACPSTQKKMDELKGYLLTVADQWDYHLGGFADAKDRQWRWACGDPWSDDLCRQSGFGWDMYRLADGPTWVTTYRAQRTSMLRDMDTFAFVPLREQAEKCFIIEWKAEGAASAPATKASE
jgi:serine/threonine protein kinase/Leucine-rich repeat (LRR) protein